MKEFLNKLKTPTKILSVVCIVLVIMLFNKCNKTNEEKGKNQQLTEHIDSITHRMDSIILVKDTIEGKYKDLMYDKNTSELTNDNKSELIDELKIRITELNKTVEDLRKDKNKYANENAWLRKENIEFKNKNLQ